MTNWRHRIQFNEVSSALDELFDFSILEDPVPQPILDALAHEVEKAIPLIRYGKQLRRAKCTAQINRILTRMWTTADLEKVWTGMPGGSPPDDFDLEAIRKQLEEWKEGQDAPASSTSCE